MQGNVQPWGSATLYRRGMDVQRFHTHQMVFPETVGRHTANVIGLLLHFYSPNLPSAELLARAALHDVPEALTGDLPAPIKSSAPPEFIEYLEEMERDIYVGMTTPYPGLTEEEETLLKIADYVDLVLTANREARLGNEAFNSVVANGKMLITKYAQGSQFSEHIAENLDNILEKL